MRRPRPATSSGSLQNNEKSMFSVPGLLKISLLHVGRPLVPHFFSPFFVLRRMRRMCVYTCAGHIRSDESASMCEPPPGPSYPITYAYQGLQANKVICCPCFTDPLGLGSYVNCNTWASCRSMLRNAYGHVGQHLVPIVAPGEPMGSKWWIPIKMVVLR